MANNPWKNHLFRWLAVFASVLGVGVLLMALAGRFNSKVPREPATKDNVPVAPDTPVAKAELIRRPRFESAVGAIEPIHQTNIASKILARVTEVHVGAGTMVAAGDVLVRLNEDELITRRQQAEAERDAAAAQLKQAQADAQRASQLIANRAISQAEFESAKTLVETTTAQLERASRSVDETIVMLDYATIKAPFSGVVIDKLVQPGDIVTPGQVLLTLYDPTQMQLVASVRESLAADLKVGQQIPARLESIDHQCLATIREIVPRSDATSRSFDVKVSGPCPPGIYSGMFGRLLIPLGDEQLLVVPTASILRAGQLTFVQVLLDGKMQRRFVQLGRNLQNRVEILSGLEPGETILLPNTGVNGASQ